MSVLSSGWFRVSCTQNICVQGRIFMHTYIPWFMVSVSSLMDGFIVRVLFRMIYS
jgi:hypothetical protein